MVSGFGTNYEPRDRKLIPSKLIVFRKFRFRPRPVFDADTTIQEWTNFAAGVLPRDRMKPLRWQVLGELVTQYGREYAEMYFGANEWEPCLTAAGYGNVAYGPGEHEAICAHTFFQHNTNISAWKEHTAPGRECTCGFWAYYTPDQIDTGCGNDWMATAAVEVWGTVVLGEKGVRAQKLRIVGLLAPKELPEAPIEVVQAWHKVVGELGVPQYWNRAEFLEFHPPQDVSELIPKKPEPKNQYFVDDSFSVTTISRRQLWQYVSTGTTTINTSSTTPYTPYTSITLPASSSSSSYGTAIPQYTYMPLTYVEDKCCVCKYVVSGQTQADADRMMAMHMIKDHVDLKGTSSTNP